MAIRSRVVRPDTVFERLDQRQQLMVSREAAQAEVLAALEALMLTGGHFTVSSERAPTEFANEAVTTYLFVTWGSASPRTSRPQPEPVSEPRFLDHDEPDEADPHSLRLSDAEIAEANADLLAMDAADDLDTADVDDQVPTAVH